MAEELSNFSQLKLQNWIVKQCHSIGVKRPTPIQANCIPKILEGKTCIGAAKTGSGKTLAFALPIVQKLYEDPYGIYALVLTPIRELAFQIADQFAILGKPMNMRTCVVVGGMDMVEQGRQLSKVPHVVVATPGRLVDHLEGCDTFTLSRIKFLVIDEADRLLGGLFDDQIKRIFSVLPKTRQSIYFSATMTDTLQTLKKLVAEDAFFYEDIGPSEAVTVAGLTQQYMLCPAYVKDAYLVELLRIFISENDQGTVMIFTNTCKNCQLLSITLNEVGMDNVALHAMIPQAQRLAALNRFKSNRVKILIATDVASRGLDIPNVQLIINHNVPRIPKEYVHRVGRTARAGRQGRAVTLVTPYDLKLLLAIEELIKTKLTECKVNDKEVAEIFTEVSVTKSEAYMKLDATDFFEKKMINLKKKWILEGLDPEEQEYQYLNKKKIEAKKNKTKIKRLKSPKGLKEAARECLKVSARINKLSKSSIAPMKPIEDQSLFRACKILVLCGGMWRGNIPNWPIAHQKLYKVFLRGAQFAYFFCLPSLVLSLWVNVDQDNEKAISVLKNITFVVVIFCKMIIIQSRPVTMLIEAASEKEQQAILSEDPQISEIHRRHVVYTEFVVKSIMLCTFLAGLAYVVGDLYLANEFYKLHPNAAPTDPKPHSIYFWFPFNPDEYYKIALTYEFVHIVQTVIYNGASHAVVNSEMTRFFYLSTVLLSVGSFVCGFDARKMMEENLKILNLARDSPASERKLDVSEFYLNFLCDAQFSELNISEVCALQMEAVCNNTEVVTLMADAWSKYPYAGMLTASRGDYGAFDQCLSINYEPVEGPRILGKQCTFGLAIPVDLTFNQFYSLSYCVPDGCSARDLLRLVNSGFLPEDSVSQLINEQICSTSETFGAWDASSIAVATLFCLVLLLVILCTFYEVFLHQRKTKNSSPLLTAFSVFNNGRKLTGTTQQTANSDQILSFHGIKVISMMWIIAGHAAGAFTFLPVTNRREVEEFESERYAQYLTTAHLAVDTFFFISGFLLAYQYFKGLANKPILVQIMAIPQMIVHRYLRMPWISQRNTQSPRQLASRVFDFPALWGSGLSSPVAHKLTELSTLWAIY
ncbi:hypothetical protein HUJ05_000174 [Dendroctonus ponderosae]|nr:hypothetical protein HUJ05_000174 [Dendroctonus ponderosae]